jgi:Mn-dependent DtxR family transcriptional regulator
VRLWDKITIPKGGVCVKIQESAENYLETILVLKNRRGEVRSIDIANEMNFSRPSVSHAMKQFRENGLITMDDNGYIELTESGREIAERIYERHTLLSELLMRLGVQETVAKEDACRLEHAISAESFQKLREYWSRHQAADADGE